MPTWLHSPIAAGLTRAALFSTSVAAFATQVNKQESLTSTIHHSPSCRLRQGAARAKAMQRWRGVHREQNTLEASNNKQGRLPQAALLQSPDVGIEPTATISHPVTAMPGVSASASSTAPRIPAEWPWTVLRHTSSTRHKNKAAQQRQGQ